MQPNLIYEENVIAPLRFQYCPMCTSPLTREVLFDDNLPRVKCPGCGWIQLASNVVGVVVVARNEMGIAAILPPHEDGIGLPAGLVEYGESPEAAAIRETLEETGLHVNIVNCLGWFYSDRRTWPGPMVQFMYEAEIIGGKIKGSDEGKAEIFPEKEFPSISSQRMGSQRAMQAYTAKVNKGVHYTVPHN
jgi:ADP-ribose pyrophosphatase YjhB (NUDIX family)